MVGEIIPEWWATSSGISRLGMSLYAQRLERGHFLWPSSAYGVVTITPAQLGYLVECIDWRFGFYHMHEYQVS